MKILSYRSTMPFNNRGPDGNPSISPTTNKSVMPFNNVTTIQDVLDGRRTIDDTYPHARGNWTSGEDVDKSYKEKGDEYMRVQKDEDILNKMFDRTQKEIQQWKIKVPGGSKSFSSFEAAQRYIRENGIPFKYLSRVAQQTKEEVNRIAVIADAMNKVFLVDSINVERGVKETGSAFCVSPGYFVTCAHVIQSYNKSLVSENINSFGKTPIVKLIQNDRAYGAELVGFDLKNDLALLKADAPSNAFKLDAESSPGEDVVVIGSPHGYENNVSTGVVGGLDREIYQYEGAPTYTFIDAAVFPGNSGGPVVRISNGQVIGMITLIVSSEGDYGLNAALPSSEIKKFVSKYIS